MSELKVMMRFVGSSLRSIMGDLKSKVALAIVLCAATVGSLSACSVHEMIYGMDRSKITPVETVLTGNMVTDVSVFYGTYRLVSGSLGRNIVSLEISPSQYGRPVFAFVDNKGIIVDRSSPPSCEVNKGVASLVGSIRCGKISFFQTDAFIRLDSAVHAKNDLPGTYSGIADGKIVDFKPNWYSFMVRWAGYPAESHDSLLEKVK
ncbi:hypothetical protein [Burkholderia pyrrocinia]|uniref:hypothetical protein n=1 Tax=Burkholderia pyrrocinia TaxID=60550 RepID=UPI0030D3DCF4